MQPSTLLPELERPEHLGEHAPRLVCRGPAAPTCLLIAAIVATAAVLATVMDWTSPGEFIPTSARTLLYVATMIAWANWFGKRAEERNDRRHNTLEAKLEARLRKSCCAEAFVDGLARQPWDPERYQRSA